MEVGETVDAPGVAVSPNQGKGIVSHSLDFTKLEIGRSDELRGATVALAGGARTEATQYLVRNDVSRAVGPRNLELRCSVRCLDCSGNG